MIQRAAVVLIVVFWVVMSVLLVRLEVSPDQSSLLTVPPAHVLKLMFLHQQQSYLHIHHTGGRIGHLSLTPRIAADGSGRELQFSGSFWAALPMVARQRVTWEGMVEMDRGFGVELMQLGVAFRPVTDREREIEIAGREVALRADLRHRVLEYKVVENGHLHEDSVFAIEEDNLGPLLEHLGIDPRIPESLRKGSGAGAVTAKRTTLKLRNEPVDAYLVRFQYGGSTICDIYVSQLGQILMVKTLLGFNLAADSLPP